MWRIATVVKSACVSWCVRLSCRSVHYDWPLHEREIDKSLLMQINCCFLRKKKIISFANFTLHINVIVWTGHITRTPTYQTQKNCTLHRNFETMNIHTKKKFNRLWIKANELLHFKMSWTLTLYLEMYPIEKRQKMRWLLVFSAVLLYLPLALTRITLFCGIDAHKLYVCVGHAMLQMAMNTYRYAQREMYLSAAIFNLIHFLRDFAWTPSVIISFAKQSHFCYSNCHTFFRLDFIIWCDQRDVTEESSGSGGSDMKNSNISQRSQRSSFRMFRQFQLPLHCNHKMWKIELEFGPFWDFSWCISHTYNVC